MKNKEEFWRKKLRELWIKKGDRNTQFFHRKVNIRANSNAILGSTINDVWISEPKSVKK